MLDSARNFLCNATDPKYEADDIIGTLAKHFENDIPVRIMTKDRDALQVVSDNTHVWLTGTKNETKDIPDGCQEFDPAAVKKIFGVYPKQFADLKALSGDASDNIPGVPGVGDKTAVPLLSKFNSIEELYDYIESHKEVDCKKLFQELGIKRSPLKQLLNHKDSAVISKQLALIAEVPMDVELGDLRYVFDIPEIDFLFSKLEFNSLIDMVA